MSEMVCNVCRAAGDDFRVPAGDHIGTAVMQEHLRHEHGVSLPAPSWLRAIEEEL